MTEPGRRWDLHCHTVYSDGTETPRELIRQARRLALAGVAITDHDTTRGWSDARAASAQMGVALLPGAELTTDDDGVSVHLLAYAFDRGNPTITGLYEATRRARMARARRMVERISKDYPITWDDVLVQVRQGSSTTVGRPHIADALVKAGIYASRSEAFAGICSSSSPYYIPTPSPGTLQALHAVKTAHGVAVVAHAGSRARNRVLLSDAQIDELADNGLDGLEVWHRENDADQRERLLTVARRRGLLVTGGSDWHGAGKPNRLGENATDSYTVGEIMRRAGYSPSAPKPTGCVVSEPTIA